MNNRSDDSRFAGAGLVCALLYLGCSVLGWILGDVIMAALR